MRLQNYMEDGTREQDVLRLGLEGIAGTNGGLSHPAFGSGAALLSAPSRSPA